MRERARILRSQGKSFVEIVRQLNVTIPKSTLSHWFKDLELPPSIIKMITERHSTNLRRGREIALSNQRRAHTDLIRNLGIKNRVFVHFYLDKRAQKIALAMLYLAEGSKNKSSVMFGNSHPPTVNMFVKLLRSCYRIDEKKFRATVQCRADQDVPDLQHFWSTVTGISSSQFYKAQVDGRSVGKPTRKRDYKGVCRVDYFSAEIDKDLKNLAEQLSNLSLSAMKGKSGH